MPRSSGNRLRLIIFVLACASTVHIAHTEMVSSAPGIGTQDFRRRPIGGDNPLDPPVDKTGGRPPKPPVPPPPTGG